MMIRTKFVNDKAEVFQVRLMPYALRVDDLVNFRDGNYWVVFGVSWDIGDHVKDLDDRPQAALDVEMLVYLKKAEKP